MVDDTQTFVDEYTVVFNEVEIKCHTPETSVINVILIIKHTQTQTQQLGVLHYVSLFGPLHQIISYVLFSFYCRVKAHSSSENQLLIFFLLDLYFFEFKKSVTVVQDDFFPQTVFFG